MVRTFTLAAISFILLLSAPSTLRVEAAPASKRESKKRDGQPPTPSPGVRTPPAPAATPVVQGRLKGCSGDALRLRLATVYGGMFAADAGKVRLPSTCMFRNEVEVQSFQRRAGKSSGVVGSVQVELQPEALKSFLAARGDARRRGLSLTPVGSDSSRRSYATSADLWNDRVEAAVTYWLRRGKLTKPQAERLRSLPPEKQVSQVLALEGRHIYFGAGFDSSILESVAPPGYSHHLSMLALDIEQYSDPRVRSILAKHGWYSTVKNDPRHFTYLGVAESRLPALGLRRAVSGEVTFWVPNIESEPRNDRTPGERKGADAPKASAGNAAERPAAGTKIPMTMSADVVILAEKQKLLSKLTQLYFESAGSFLHITSGYRPPEEQAKAMYRNLVAYGDAQVLGNYGNSAAAAEIVGAFRQHTRDREKALGAMTKVIRGQVARGVYVSLHLVGRAFDIRLSSASLATLSKVVKSMGGELVVEADHYHVEF